MRDAPGKTLDQPVHQFLSGKRMDIVPLAFCLGMLSNEDSGKKARQPHNAGFSVLKTKRAMTGKQASSGSSPCTMWSMGTSNSGSI